MTPQKFGVNLRGAWTLVPLLVGYEGRLFGFIFIEKCLFCAFSLEKAGKWRLLPPPPQSLKNIFYPPPVNFVNWHYCPRKIKSEKDRAACFIDITTKLQVVKDVLLHECLSVMPSAWYFHCKKTKKKRQICTSSSPKLSWINAIAPEKKN